MRACAVATVGLVTWVVFGGLEAVRAETVPIGRYVEVRVGVSQRHPYPAPGGGARRSGRSRMKAPEMAPARAWSVTLPARKLLPPTITASGLLLLGSSMGLHALDARTGEQRWFAEIGPMPLGPALAPNGEILALGGGKLVALTEQGQVRALREELFAGAWLVLDSGSVVVGGRDGTARALALDGSELSASRIAVGGLRWSVLRSESTVVLAGDGDELASFAVESGEQRSVRLPDRLAAGPVVGDDGTVWLLGQGGGVFTLPAAGTIRRVAELGASELGAAPAIGRDGALRVGLRHGEVVCLTPTGAERWRRGIDAQPGAILIDANDTALLVSSRGTLYAIDRDGNLRWRQALELRAAGRPVIGADGTLYLVGRGGQVQAWR
jgi:outer membrane protein assembly factor BamB